MKISMIAAMAHNRVIGKDNDMPWHLPADLKHFKQVTLGKPVIMGRKTLESIGRALPGRRNIVISRNGDYQFAGAETATSVEQALSMVEGVEEVMIIGGGNIYSQCLPLCHTLYLTFIDLDVSGDTCFPDYEAVGPWHCIEREQHGQDETNPHNYEFVTLSKEV
ncbi:MULTISPECIES: type 3 dihydrofolate reductase [unclassified Pseudoalteromonas]|uniref:type 3 dihydrofolate reductase n=2 Tax=unclassified Pseudoalteromonas TaxID=194690 RepID=UPI001F28ED27|nr:type 3 dihydrofolate reductase [Pseudoalteromonas sp. T1lg75]